MAKGSKGGLGSQNPNKGTEKSEGALTPWGSATQRQYNDANIKAWDKSQAPQPGGFMTPTPKKGS